MAIHLKKKIKACHDDKFNLGDYVLWNNQYWLITLLDPDEKTWNRGYMYLCTVPLRWQNSDGEIIVRWAYSEDFTKYSSGVIGNNAIQIGDNQYGLTLPIDSETKKLKRDKRFAIDFDDAVEPDIYMLTNRKVNLNNNQYFGRGGIMTTTMSFNAFNAEKDKQVELEDGSQVWICDYHSPTDPPAPDETTDLSVLISGNPKLKIGYPRTYSVSFLDADKNELSDINFKWNIKSEFPDKIICEEDGNKIKISLADGSLVNESFLLQILINNKTASEFTVTVVDVI